MKTLLNSLSIISIMVCFILNIIQTVNAQTESSQSNNLSLHRIYDCLLNPREYPDDTRRNVQPPDWNTFGNRIRFMYQTDFGQKDGVIVDYVKELDRITKTYELGDVIKVTYPLVYGKNLGDVADEFKRRGLFLFSLYGYVPGSGPGGFWRQYKAPVEAMSLLEQKLGDHWLGMENGEQDGRYIGGFASQLYPVSSSRLEQYLNFQWHFEKHGDDVGNRMTLLVSLNFAHHFTKEGVYSLIGAETAQALPNSQVYYAFLRGAGKQYGVPWFGNASVFNRWGYKVYGSEGVSDGYKYGPRKGTSANLMKRLMYSHILYNCMHVGFESSLLEGDKLSPLGRIQRGAQQWLKQIGQPGVMLTPTAVMVDFYSGWSFPRHLYSSNVYRVWGNLPYEAGDYLTDGVLDMIYPGYQNSSYYHDESGFISPTPYGDAADCILSDAPAWLLERYQILVVAGEISGGVEIRDNLQSYVNKGGHLFITAGSLAKLPDGLAGVKISGSKIQFKSKETIQSGLSNYTEDYSFELYTLELPTSVKILSSCGKIPAVIEVPLGKGSVTVFASPFGVSAEIPPGEAIKSEIDKPLPKPYPLLKHVRAVLDKAFRSMMLFEVGENLSLITNRKAPGEYLLCISNNSLQKLPFQIMSRCGPIESIREFELDQSEKGTEGYVPEGFEDVDLGVSDAWNIAGGDVRLFTIRVREENVETIPHVKPPHRPKDRILPVRGLRSIKEEILARPTFFEHFDKVVIDWKYIRYREKEILKKECGWLSRQKLGIIVDLTSGINLYPDLRLVNNLEEDYVASMVAINDVMNKMEIIGAHDLIISLHRGIENNFTREQTRASFDSTMRVLCKIAEKRQITIHLRTCFGKPPSNLKDAVQFVERVDAPNLKLAPSTALLMAEKTNIGEAVQLLQGKIGMWLVSAPVFDIAGILWNANAPISECKQKPILSEILSIARNVPIVLDGLYENQDEEYKDIYTLETILTLVWGN